MVKKLILCHLYALQISFNLSHKLNFDCKNNIQFPNTFNLMGSLNFINWVHVIRTQRRWYKHLDTMPTIAINWLVSCLFAEYMTQKISENSEWFLNKWGTYNDFHLFQCITCCGSQFCTSCWWFVLSEMKAAW